MLQITTIAGQIFIEAVVVNRNKPHAQFCNSCLLLFFLCFEEPFLQYDVDLLILSGIKNATKRIQVKNKHSNLQRKSNRRAGRT